MNIDQVLRSELTAEQYDAAVYPAAEVSVLGMRRFGKVEDAGV